MNFFGPKNTAERYSRGRPYFHEGTVSRIGDYLKIKKTSKLSRILDIACGTGMSTKALKLIGEDIYGTDISEEMLNYAREEKGIKFIKSKAEEQPFEDSSFDLLTVSSGVHWFEIDKFLKESNRLLIKEGWLIIYDNYFLSEMKEEIGFRDWFPEIYLKKYPSPSRNNKYDWTKSNLREKGFELINEERFKNEIIFTKEELILYFTTQSNISSVINKGNESYKEIENWLAEELSKFYDEEKTTRTLKYGNWIKYLKKINPSHNNVHNDHFS